MKAEAWVFGITALFVAVVAPAYWFMSEDPTGTSALVMTALLFGMVTLYLGFHASRMDPRPEDRKEGEIADGAGELGFFPPFSYWPFALGLSAALMGLALAFWYIWLVLIAGVALLVTVGGLLFEYYVGQNSHQSEF